MDSLFKENEKKEIKSAKKSANKEEQQQPYKRFEVKFPGEEPRKAEKKKKKIPLFAFTEKKTLNDIAADTIEAYETKLEEEQEESGLKQSIDNYTMKQLLSHMENDTNKKHKAFRQMEDAFKTLVDLSEYNENAKQKGFMQIDYRDALRLAESTAKYYQLTHKKWMHLTGSGSSRYRISCRIVDVVSGLNDQMIKNTTEVKKKVDEKVKDTQVQEILSNDSLSEKVKGELINKWYGNSAEYKDVLKKLISGKEFEKKDKETLERIIADKNNRLIANKMTLSMICDENPQLTLGLSDMKDKLSKYLTSKINGDQHMFDEVKEFRIHMDAILKDFEKENSKILATAKVRMEKYAEVLGIDKKDERFWEKSEVNSLMLNADDSFFQVHLNILKEQAESNYEIIDQIVAEKGYSSLSLQRIKDRIKANLGTKYVYGGEIEIADAVKDSLSYVTFLAPAEIKAEQTVEHLMKVCQIPPVDKDVFARYLAGGDDVTGINQFDSYTLREKAAQFVINLSGQAKVNKKYGFKHRMLKAETWEAIEKLKFEMGAYTKEEFKAKFDELIRKNDETIDLTKPNIKYADFMEHWTQEKPARQIGFSKRILGDLFLEDKDVCSVLDKDDVEYLRENLIKSICGSDAELSKIEYLPTSDIKLIAGRLKQNIVGNKDFIKGMKEECKDDRELINKVILGITMLNGTASLGDLNDLVHSTGESLKMSRNQALEKKKLFDSLKPDAKPDGTLDKVRYEHFMKQHKFICKYKNGRYKNFVEKLCGETFFYLTVMDCDENAVKKFLDGEIEKKLGKAIDAINAAQVPDAVKQIYIDKNYELIFSGKLSGETVLFKSELEKLQITLQKEANADGKSIEKNIQSATKTALKEVVGKDKKNAEKTAIVYFCAQEVITSLYGDKNTFKKLMSHSDLKDEIVKACSRYDHNSFQAEFYLKKLASINPESIFAGEEEGIRNIGRFIRSNMKLMANLSEADFKVKLAEMAEDYEKIYKRDVDYTKANKTSEEEQKVAKKIIETKKSELTIKDRRDTFFGTIDDRKALADIYTSKALVNVRTKKLNSLNSDDWKRARDRVESSLAKYNKLDSFLTDLLVEKNVNARFDKTINEHAKWLADVSDILSSADDKEEAISEDEHRLLVVNAYRHIDDFADTDRKSKFLSKRRFVKTEWYKIFRKNYKILKQLESLEISHGPLVQERMDVARDLRALLATGIGVKEQDDKANAFFSEKAEKAVSYFKYIDAFMTCADKALETDAGYRKTERFIRDKYLLALRQYYHESIFTDLESGKDAVFDEAKWSAELKNFASSQANLKYILNEKESDTVSSKEYGIKNKNFLQCTGKDVFENLINKNGAHGWKKKYNKLSTAEKELFALGLMLMEKGAIGFDGGSASVLAEKNLRTKEAADRLKELTNYMSGKDYDFRIDYSVCCYKLINKGTDIFGDRLTLSKSAFEKALQFAKGVTAKVKEGKEKVTAADKKRMGDGISSIYEAAFLGKKQIDDVFELRKKDFTPESVKTKLLELAKSEKSLNTIEKTFNKKGDIPVLFAGSFVMKKINGSDFMKEINARKKVLKKLSEMDEIDMHRFIAVLQNRAALDTTSADSKKYIDEEKREELKLLFSEDNHKKTFGKFVSNGACMQALVTALSFKFNDKKTLQGRALGKGDFDAQSFNRYGKIDWVLLAKAVDFMNEMEKDNRARFAMRNASNYVLASGNKKAIETYKKEFDKAEGKDIAKDQLEDFLKKESEKDRVSGKNKDAKIALAGYNNLSEKQKKLFIKVLGRRDFLDISKKNFYMNVFRASKERNFANETGRFRLIDEYIDKSLRGNEGVSLGENAYTDAFKSLLSTQVDDSVDFTAKKDIGDILSNERCYIFKRDTAVDWKLFLRALQFVQRAEYELEMREGNDELYRSAGKISSYGKLSMDYSILRRNIHNTGNGYFRFGVQKGKKVLTDETLNSTKLPLVGMSVAEIKKSVKDYGGMLMPSISEAIDKLDDMLASDEVKKESRISELPSLLTTDPMSYDIKGILKNKLTGTFYTSTTSLTNDINNLVVSSVTSGVDLSTIGKLVKGKLTEKTKNGRSSRLDEIIGSYELQYEYGDIRDDINLIFDKYDKTSTKINGIVDKAKNYTNIAVSVESFVNLTIAKSIKETVENKYAEATAYVMSNIDSATGKVSDDQEHSPFVTKVKEIVESTINMHKDSDKEIQELLAKPQEILNKVQETIKTSTSEILNGALGENTVNMLQDKYNIVKGFGDSLVSKYSFVVSKINKYKVFIDGFRDIAVSIKNKQLLNDATNRANDQSTMMKDRATLKKAEEVQDERQKQLNKNTVAEHKDIQKLSVKTADTIQNMAIVNDVAKMGLAVAEEIYGKVDVGIMTGAINSAINAGIEFATYCIRCMQDKEMLKSYYTDTEKGQKAVRGIKDSYASMVGSREVMDAELNGMSVLDIVCTGKGYENIEELVADTGMRMANSIAFCASKFNPVKETRVMAATVMLVLGLKSSIGKTDANTINSIFLKMKAA
ncbi:MAG: hypothetical protein K6A72_02765 [Lachnospiraceae bacterium]|nr:hypothetical protein [Lachnospiraceae bacterium]